MSLNQNLFIVEGLKGGLFEEEEFRHYLWFSVKNAMAEYYLKKKISQENPKLTEVQISESDIQKLYRANREIYKTMGLSEEAALEYIHETALKEERERRVRAFEGQLINYTKLQNKIDFPNTR